MENSNVQYAEKMNAGATEQLCNWWENLTKTELLAYLADSPEVTADTIRDFFKNSNTTLSLSLSFDIVAKEAHATFFERT